jgi:hypothetical protein
MFNPIKVNKQKKKSGLESASKLQQIAGVKTLNRYNAGGYKDIKMTAAERGGMQNAIADHLPGAPLRDRMGAVKGHLPKRTPKAGRGGPPIVDTMVRATAADIRKARVVAAAANRRSRNS